MDRIVSNDTSEKLWPSLKVSNAPGNDRQHAHFAEISPEVRLNGHVEWFGHPFSMLDLNPVASSMLENLQEMVLHGLLVTVDDLLGLGSILN
jgi:hypothetical protein